MSDDREEDAMAVDDFGVRQEESVSIGLCILDA
jgi:hypothetical protein